MSFLRRYKSAFGHGFSDAGGMAARADELGASGSR